MTVAGALNIMKELLSGNASYRVIFQARCLTNAQAATTTGITETGLGLPGGNNGGLDCFYINPADYPAGSTLRIVLSAAVNAVTPASDFTAALYPVTGSAGGENAVSVTVGAQVAESAAKISAPVKETLSEAASGAITMPASAGLYLIQIIVSANNAAKSAVALRARLEVRS